MKEAFDFGAFVKDYVKKRGTHEWVERGIVIKCEKCGIKLSVFASEVISCKDYIIKEIIT